MTKVSFSKKMKGCWTCKDRKIRCDKQAPACNNCLHSNRKCLGYGLRLSWPSKNDQRRAILAKDPSHSASYGPDWLRGQRRFLNVFASDIVLLNNMIDGNLSPPPQTSIIKNPTWIPLDLDTRQFELLAYYNSVVSQMVTSAHDPRVQSLIGRMSFTENSPSSYAVLQATCALAAMQLYGPAQASIFKAKAISAFEASLRTETEVRYILRRIVAAILLALYDILTSAKVPYTWAYDICYAKRTVISTYTLDISYQGDLATVLDWSYYHDVLSRFSIRHWKRRTREQTMCARNPRMTSKQLNASDKTTIMSTSNCSLEILITLSQVFDLVMEGDENSVYPPETLDKLERRLKYAQQELRIDAIDDPDAGAKAENLRNVAELYRLAALVYLHRAARKSPTWTPVLMEMVDKAFTIIADLQTCDRTFPLFIIACEARTDLRRGHILRILDSTRDQLGSGNSMRMREFIERFWAQEDLDTAQRIGYMPKLAAILSTSIMLPPFT